MARYANQVGKATSSVTIGVASIEAPGSGMRRFKLYEAIFGSDAATPADNAFRFELNRSTTAATGTAVTPEPLDMADAPSVTLLKTNLTVQGTNTAGKIPLTVPLNQRATFRWVANPGCEIVVPATATYGLHLNTPVASNTPSVAATLMFEEQ